MRKQIWVLALGIILFGLGGAIMAENNPEYTFTYKFQTGQEFSYLVSVHGQVAVETPQGLQQSPVNIEMEFRQKVEKFDGERAQIFMEITSAKTFQGSDSAALPEEGQKSLFIMDKTGKAQYKSGGGGNQWTEYSQLIFPQHPLKLGDAWAQEAATTTGPQASTLTCYTFQGFEKIGTQSCAIFDSEVTLGENEKNTPSPEASSTGRIFFNAELGQVEKVVVDSRFTFMLPYGIGGLQQALTTTTLHTEMRRIGR